MVSNISFKIYITTIITNIDLTSPILSIKGKH